MSKSESVTTTPFTKIDCGFNVSEALYSMKLNDELKVGGLEVRRVPGGWLYGCPSFGVFVPFDNEFMPTGVPDDLPF